MKTKLAASKPKSCLSKSIATLLATTLLSTAWVHAAPQGATVVQGHATITQKGDKMTIRPSDNAVINYSSFSIGKGETVRFIQLGVDSRVLNRVIDPNPTHIFGTLQANGNVFIVNPYGVYLENGSVLNVGSFTAAAGHLSDADFLGKRDHFTELNGTVSNAGSINARNDIRLIGGNVSNFGTLVSQQGTVALVSGSDVLIGKHGSNIYVNAAPTTRKTSAGNVTAGVQNSGRIQAPHALLAAGDLYAVAISNTGIIRSQQATLTGGANSTVHVSGTIDASNKAGKGGQVKITGGHVELQKATVDASGSTGGGNIVIGGDPGTTASVSSSITMDAASTLRASSTSGAGGRVVIAGSQDAASTVNLSGLIDASSKGGVGGQIAITGVHLTLQGLIADASGTTGGGTILVGGDLHGQGATPTATTTSVDATTTLKADATVQGNGGKVVVWSNDTTDYAGTISARGAGLGNGGNAEVSGKGQLNYQGTTLLTATSGKIGTLLLDPTNITIAASGSNTITGGLVAFGDTPANSTISSATLVGALSTADVILQATNDITFTTGVTSASTHGLTLQAGHSILFGGNTINLGGSLTATASDPGGIPAATPVLSSTGTLQATSISLSNSGGAITVGAMTSAGAITLNGTSIALNGTVNAGTLSVTGATTLAANVTTNTSTSNAQFYHSNVTLGANVILTTTSSQTITFGGTIDSDSTARSLSIQLANVSNNIFFNGNIGSTAPLASLTLTGIPVFQSTATSITTTGAQQLGSQVILFGGTTTFTSTGSGTITFGNVDAGDNATAHSLTVNTAGNVTFNGLVSSIMAGGVPVLPVTNLSVTNASGTATFNGGAVYTTGTQSYAGAATLGADTTFTGSSITFSKTLAAGAHNLTLTTATLEFDGAVSGTGHLALQGASAAVPYENITVSTYNEIQTGFTDVTFGRSDGTSALLFDGFTLHNPTIFLGGTGDITIDTLTGNFALTANTSGNTIFNSGVSVGSVTTDAAGTTTINASITTTGAQTYNDNVTVGGTATLQTTNSAVRFAGTTTLGANLTVSAGSGNITFTGAVNGAGALTANSTGTTLFSSTVGATTALTSLTTDAGGGTTLSGNVTTTGTQSYGDNVTLAATSTLSTINSTVTVGGTTTLNGDLIVSAGTGNITFTGAVNGAHALTADSTGTTLFGSTVGGTTTLTSLTTDAGGTTTLSGNVTTTGAQSYGDNVAIASNATLATTNSAIGIGGTTTLSGNLTLSSGTANITLTGAVNGADALVANSTGTTLFSSTVGATTALTSLTTDSGGGTTLSGNVTTTGTQSYGDNVTIANNATLATTNSAATFSGTTTLNGNLTVSTGTAGVTFTGAINGAHSLTANNSGTTLFSSTIGATTALTALTTNAGGTTTLTGNVTTSGALQIDDNATIATGITMTSTGDIVGFGNNTTLNGDLIVNAGSNIIFAGTVNGAHALTLNTSALTDIRAAIGDTTALTSLTTNAGGSTSLAGNVTTTGAQNYGDNVSTTTGLTLSTTNSTVSFAGTTGLGGDLTVSTGTGNITFTGAVNGAHALSANSTGTTLFSSTVGNSTALTSLTTDTSGGTTLTGNVTTTGTQSYGDNVTVAATSTLSTTNSVVSFSGTTTLNGDLTVSSGTGNIIFTGAVNGAHALIANSSGTTLFSTAVGGTTALTSLTTDATGTTTLTGNVTTTGGQSYGDPVTLAAASTLTSTGNGTISLAAVNGAFALTVSSTGTGQVTLGGAIGGTTALSSLSITGGTAINLNGGPITTTGSQTYTGAANLGVTTTLTSTGNGTITLGTVNGAQALTASSAGTGTVVLGGVIGGTTALTSLSVTGGAAIDINAGVTTTGNQTYTGPVVLGSSPTLTSTGNGTIDFTSSINATADGAQGLTLNAGSTGTLIFGGPIGNVHTLSTLSILGSTPVTFTGNVTTVNSQNYSGEVTLAADTVLTSSAGSITLAGVDGAHALTLSGNTGTTLNGEIGATTALTSLNITGTSPIRLNSDLVQTTGSQTYSGPLTLGFAGVTSLTSTSNGTLTFGTIDGSAAGRGLTVSSGATGSVVFDGAIGSTTPLDSLTVSGAAPITMDAATVTTANNQSYTGAMTLVTGAILTSSSAGITLGKVDGASAFTLNAATTVTLDGEVGATTRIGFFSMTAPAINVNTDLVLTSGGQFYNGAVVLGTTSTFDNISGSFFFRAIDATTGGGQGLTITGSGGTSGTFAGNLGNTHALASFTLGAGLSSEFFGGVKTTGNQSFQSNITLANAVTFTSSAGTVSLGAVNSNSTPAALTVSGALGVTLGDELGATTQLQSLTVSASGGTIAFNTDLAKTSGAQTYNDAMVLQQNTTLNAGGNVSLAAVDGTTSGGQSLTVTTTGTTTFHGAVGATHTLSSVDVNGTGAIAINGSAIDTVGAQTYTGAATIGATTDLSSTTGGAIHFLSSINDATTGTDGLTIDTSGAITFDGAVGATHALKNLELTNAASTLAVNGGIIDVTGDANFQGAVQAGTQALSIQAGSLTFAGPVSGTSTLTLFGSSAATGILVAGGSGFTPGPLTGAAPLVISLADLGEIQSGFTHITIGSGSNNLPIDSGAWTLTTDVTLASSTGAIAVSGLNSDATTPRNLILTTTGTTTIVGSLGATHALASLDVTGPVAIDANVTTTGTQTYEGTTTVGATSTLSTTNSNVHFAGTTALSADLTVSTGTGDITFTGAIDGPAALTANSTGTTTFSSTAGATTALTSITTDAGGTTVLNGNMTTSGAQTYGDNITLDAASTLTSTAGNISLQQVDGAFDLTVSGATGVTLNGNIGSGTPLASFTAEAPGHSITLNASAVTTTGAQTYSNALVLGQTATLTSGDAVSLAAVDATTAGVQGLTVDASGTTTFNGVVGGTTALNSVTVNGTGAIAIDTTGITTTGAQLYTTATTLGANATLASTGSGTITFDSTVDDATSGAHSLTIQTAGAVVLGDSVGATTALAAVTVTGPSNTQAGGLTVGSGDGTAFTMVTTGAVNLNTPLADNASVTEFDVQSLAIAGNITRTLTSAPNLKDNFTVNASGDVQLLGNAFTTAAGGNGAIGILSLTSTGGNVTVQSLTALNSASLQGAELILGQPAPSASNATITLDGGQTLLLNNVTNTSTSGEATILHSPASSLVLMASQEIDMGAGQRLNAASGISQLNALSIPIASTGVSITAPKVVLGDIATAGSLTVTSADIELLGRAPVPQAPAIQPGTFDKGLSLIGTRVTLSSEPTFVPGTPQDQQKVYIAAGSITGFTTSSSVVFVADSNVVNQLAAFDTAHPGLQPTDGALPGLPIVTGRNTPPAPPKRSAALPFNFLIDDASILALLNDDARIWAGLIDTEFAFDDDDRRHIRHRRPLALKHVLMTAPDYPLVINPRN